MLPTHPHFFLDKELGEFLSLFQSPFILVLLAQYASPFFDPTDIVPLGSPYLTVFFLPVSGLVITSAGSGYANGNTVTISGGTANATANVTTNGAGAITNLTIINSGSGFKGTPTVSITAGGTGAVITPVLGGRANRVNDEVLVALGSMTS